jgi:hypothetical protein
MADSSKAQQQWPRQHVRRIHAGVLQQGMAWLCCVLDMNKRVSVIPTLETSVSSKRTYNANHLNL